MNKTSRRSFTQAAFALLDGLAAGIGWKAREVVGQSVHPVDPIDWNEYDPIGDFNRVRAGITATKTPQQAFDDFVKRLGQMPKDRFGNLLEPLRTYPYGTLDPQYHAVNDGNHKFREGLRLFVNGMDRHCETKECKLGADGWANLILKREVDGKLISVRDENEQFIVFSIRGKVEFRGVVEYTDAGKAYMEKLKNAGRRST
jgi:hypothetical protein